MKKGFQGAHSTCTFVVPSAAAAALKELCGWQIVDLGEYYPYRTEVQMLEENVISITKQISPGSVVVELGCGSATKTRIILDSLLERYPHSVSHGLLPADGFISSSMIMHIYTHNCGYHQSTSVAGTG